MRDAIVLVFFLFALMLSGVLISAWNYIRDEYSQSQEIKIWVSSVFFSVIGLTLFSIGTAVTPEAMKSSSIIFTFANMFYVASIVTQTLFCFSLIQNINQKIFYIFYFGVFLFAVHYEYLRGSGDFAGRVLEVATISSIFLLAQLIYLRKALKKYRSVQIRFLIVFTLLELAMVVLRLTLSALLIGPIPTISAIPINVMAAIWLNLAFNVLSYLTMLGFWSERARLREIAIISENERISSLLSERESLIDSLLNSNKTAATGALSVSLAHELNQPISAINANIYTLEHLIQSNSLDSQELKRLVGWISADNKRAGDIVHSLSSMFRDEPVRFENSSIQKLISEVVKIVEPECRSHNIEVQVDLAEDANVLLNQNEIKQVLLNLLNNSISALKSSGEISRRIELSASHNKNELFFVVVDNGPGVSPLMQNKLFELLASDKKGGTGLGLWLSHHIALRHRGSLVYECVKPHGAKFILSIPRI